MSTPTDNENWIIDAGDTVIQKKADCGLGGLSPLERLIYCLWVADYSMRNAGDLETAGDLFPEFPLEAVNLAGGLSLVFTQKSFSLGTTTLQRQYFQRFDLICDELKTA